MSTAIQLLTSWVTVPIDDLKPAQKGKRQSEDTKPKQASMILPEMVHGATRRKGSFSVFPMSSDVPFLVRQKKAPIWPILGGKQSNSCGPLHHALALRVRDEVHSGIDMLNRIVEISSIINLVAFSSSSFLGKPINDKHTRL